MTSSDVGHIAKYMQTIRRHGTLMGKDKHNVPMKMELIVDVV